MSKISYEDLLKKKDKLRPKLTPKSEPIKLETKKQIPKQPTISSSPSRNKSYQHVTSRIQSSRLPVSVNNKKITDRSNKEESITQDKSSLLTNETTSLQPSFSSSLSSTSSNDDEELNRLNEMLERFRHNKEPSPSYLNKPNPELKTNKHVDRQESDQSDNESSSSNDNETDIENLKNRLNNLRQKLFKNDYENSLDEKDHKTKTDSKTIERPPIQPKNVKMIAKQPILLETNKFNSSNKIKTNSNVNIESIDLKAKQLIEKSESSLSEKLVSSDGLGSSRTSTSTISTISSIFQDTQPYKSEFIKYLENKTKIGNTSETSDIFKPEDDILYQWRLRRKLEEAKKLAPISEPKLESFPVKIFSTSQPIESQSSSSQKQTTITPTKHSMQTQTNNVCDSAVQTSLDSICLSINNKNNNKEKKLEILNEIQTQTDELETPTRDLDHLNTIPIDENKTNLNQAQKTKLKVDTQNKIELKSNEYSKKSNFSLASPTRTKSRYLTDSNDLNSLKSVNNISADLTKVSSIYDNNSTTNVPKTSNSSPIIFNQHKLIKKPLSIASSNLNSASSSMTVVTASAEIKSNRSSPTNLDQTIVISAVNNVINYKLDSKASRSNIDDHNQDESNEYDYIQKEMIESDEILRILLKKSYFYRLKLKQIDELLTK